MIKVKVNPEKLGDINPTDFQLACATIKRRLEDHPEPGRLRARRKWPETVEVAIGSASIRFVAGCAIRNEGTDWFVEVTTIRKQKGQRGNPRAQGRG